MKELHPHLARQLVRDLYLKVLKREPDLDGLQHYAFEDLLNYDEIQNAFLRSDEYKQLLAQGVKS